MAWPGKVEAKDILGMEQDDFKKKLDKIDSAPTKEDLTAMQTSITESLKASLGELEGRLTPKPAPKPLEKREPVEFDPLEPEKYIQDQISSAVNPATQLALNSTAELVKMRVLETLPYYHEKAFKKEIDDLLGRQPIQYRCSPEAVKNAYDAVVGKHMDDITGGKIKSKEALQLESSSNNGGNGGIGEKKKETLSEDEMKYAKMFGQTTEEYIASKGKLRFVS